MSKCTYFFTAALAASMLFLGCGKATDKDKALIMITESGFPPYEYLEGNEIVGVDVEICRAVATKLGKKLAVQDAKFDAVIPSVIANKADFAAAGITITEDRKASVDFSLPYVTSGIVIVSKKGAEFKSIEEAKGKRIGVQGGTTSDTFCVELGIEPDRYDSPAMAAAALKAGKLDLIIVDIDPAKNVTKGEEDILISSDFLSKEEFAIAIRKGQPEFLKVIDETIAELLKNGKIEAWKNEYDARYAAMKGVEEEATPEVAPAEEVKAEVAPAEEVKAEVAPAPVEAAPAEEAKAEAAPAEEVKAEDTPAPAEAK